MSLTLSPPRFTDPAVFGRVAVLLGGPGSEREVSLQSGQGVLDALRSRGVDAVQEDLALELVLKLLSREGLEAVQAQALKLPEAQRTAPVIDWLPHPHQPPKESALFRHAPSSLARQPLLALLLARVNGLTSEELAAVDPLDWLTQLGLGRQLSPSRSNGLNAVLQRMRELTAN